MSGWLDTGSSAFSRLQIGQRQSVFDPVGIPDTPPVKRADRAAEFQKAHPAISACKICPTGPRGFKPVGMSSVLHLVSEIVSGVEDIHPEILRVMPLFSPDDRLGRLDDVAFFH